MAFLAYFDAAGDGSNIGEHEMAVSGFVAQDTKWREFEQRWAETLHRFGLVEFHMKDFAHFKGAFKQFKNDEPRRREFLQEASAVINDCTARPFGAAIDLDAYRWFNQRYHVDEFFGNAYTIGLLLCMGEVTLWHERQRLQEPLLFYVEKGDNEQSVFAKLMNSVDWAREAFTQPLIVPKRRTAEDGTVSHVLPFQACDYLAYEHARVAEHVKDGKLTMRKSASLITGYPHKWKPITRRVLWNQVKRMGIPPRPHHPPEDPMPEGPLCFLGNHQPLINSAGHFHN